MRPFLSFFAFLLVGAACMPAAVQPVAAQPVAAQPVAAQPAASGRAHAPAAVAEGGTAAEGSALHHVIGHPAVVFMKPDSTRPYLEVGFREPLYLLDRGPRWSHVRTADGAKGYVRSHAISNVWVHVSKTSGRLSLYEGTHRLMTAPADFGYNAFLDKAQRGSSLRRDDWRTPEGTLYVVRKNAHSRFNRALLLNYPTVEDADRGLKRGLISAEEHRAIADAQKALTAPPMNTALGGMIEIHGEGTGASRNWTHGCVAIHNRDLRQMWNRVEIGTPVVIE